MLKCRNFRTTLQLRCRREPHNNNNNRRRSAPKHAAHKQRTQRPREVCGQPAERTRLKIAACKSRWRVFTSRAPMSVNQAAVSSLLHHRGTSLLRSVNRKAQTNAGEIKEVYRTNTPPLSEHLSAASLFNLQPYPGVSGPAGDFYCCRRLPQSFYTCTADLIHLSKEVDVKMMMMMMM